MGPWCVSLSRCVAGRRRNDAKILRNDAGTAQGGVRNGAKLTAGCQQPRWGPKRISKKVGDFSRRLKPSRVKRDDLYSKKRAKYQRKYQKKGPVSQPHIPNLYISGNLVANVCPVELC